jgi:hypothetical protein
MKIYDKFLYCYFKLKKKDDIYSVFLLSLIQFLNFLTFIMIFSILIHENIVRNKNWNIYFYPFIPIFMCSNIIYVLKNKKFGKIIETYKNVSEKKITTGKMLVIFYLLISIFLFLLFIPLTPKP